MTRLATFRQATASRGSIRLPIVGGRYRYIKTDILTGKTFGWAYATCVDVIDGPSDLNRRCTMVGDSGHVWHPFLDDFWKRYQAVDNVLLFRRVEQ